MSKGTLKAVDFFCGGGGMSYGMQEAGIKVLAGIDFEPACKETYEANINDAQFLLEDVFKLTEQDLQKKLDLKKNDDDLILIGCSPCQFWSIINTDKKKSKKSKNLLVEFKRFVEYFKPGYVVVENVPGVLRKKKESGLDDFITWLNENEYNVHFKVHNVNDYGVPQSRKRFTLIANRVSDRVIEPLKEEGKKPVLADYIGVDNGFPKVKAGNRDESDFMHTVAGLNEINIKRLQKTKKNGGSRTSYMKDKKLAPSCHYNDGVNFKDTYGRMSWNKPASTITTKFFSISNGRFAHPEENRAISLREGAVLQSFPKTYKFRGTSIGSIARIIGNAVPPRYAERIGLAIINS
jgi:DNA (cytosine-5)-methyltransferase 1